MPSLHPFFSNAMHPQVPAASNLHRSKDGFSYGRFMHLMPLRFSASSSRIVESDCCFELFLVCVIVGNCSINLSIGEVIDLQSNLFRIQSQLVVFNDSLYRDASTSNTGPATTNFGTSALILLNFRVVSRLDYPKIKS